MSPASSPPPPIAEWDPTARLWRQPNQDLYGHSAPYSETWPTSGAMRTGSVSARPTSAPRTSGGASSSSRGPLMKTPTAQLATNGGSQHPDKRRAGGHGPTLADEVEHLLPTPAARDWKSGASNIMDRNARPLNEVAVNLLPTPRATDGSKGGPNQRGSSGDLMLPSAVVQLLPTPTATPYGNNQSPSPGATVRPSLDSLAPTLTGGAASAPPSPAGSESPGGQLQLPLSPDAPDNPASPRGSSSG